MDPNSKNQLWSRWTATIFVRYKTVHSTPTFQNEMRAACARFYRKLFGSATELKIDQTQVMRPGLKTKFVVDCRTEGHPAPDPAFRRAQMDEIAAFFGKNLRRYGEVNVHIDVKIEAGDAGDGKPPAQLIMGPPIVLMPQARLLPS